MPFIKRERWAEIALESVLIVFAVLLALALDEWREHRQRSELAGRVQHGVVLELARNLEELEAALNDNRILLADLERQLDSIAADSSASLTFSMNVAELSSAAFGTMRMTEVAPFMEFDWIARSARAYDRQEFFAELQLQLLDVLATSFYEADSPAEMLKPFLGRLAMLLQFGDGLREAYQEVIGAAD